MDAWKPSLKGPTSLHGHQKQVSAWRAAPPVSYEYTGLSLTAQRNADPWREVRSQQLAAARKDGNSP